MVRLVKDLALSLQCLGSLWWRGFSPWPGSFCRCSQKTEETPTPRLLRRVDEACPGALVLYMQSVNIPIGHIKTKAVTTHMPRQKTKKKTWSPNTAPSGGPGGQSSPPHDTRARFPSRIPCTLGSVHRPHLLQGPFFR